MKSTSNYILLVILFLTGNLCLGQSDARWSMELGIRPQVTLLKQSELIEPTAKVGLDVHAMPTFRLTKHIDLLFPLGYRSVTLAYDDYNLVFGCDDDGQGGVDLKSSYAKIEDRIGIYYIGLGARIHVLENYFVQSTLSILGRTSLRQQQYDEYACGVYLPPSGLSCDCLAEDHTSLPLHVTVGLGRTIVLSKRIRLFSAVDFSYYFDDYEGYIQSTQKRVSDDITIRQLGLSMGVQYAFGVN